ncbi:MAG TPA: hypothetical protein VFC70_04175, partial [Oscillospiraceae bacterium]|nr:hypothetical protein [Oscillospiraceae bacterium]
MYNDFFEQRDKIGISNEENDLNVITRIYNNWLGEAKLENNVRKLILWDYELLSCIENSLHIGSGEKNRLVSALGWGDEAEWPDIKNFEEERIEFYVECFNKTKNKIMKCRYLDYLIECDRVKNKYVYANKLCGELISLCTINEGGYPRYFTRISRLVDLAVKFNKRDTMKRAEEILVNDLDSLVDKTNYRWILENSQLLRYLCYYRKEKRIEQKTIDKVIGYLELAKGNYYSSKETTMYQYFSCELLNWYRAEKYSAEDIRNVLLDIGKSYELEAEHQGGREKKSNFVRAHFLECAMEHYINIGERDKVSELKVKIKKAYRDISSNNELKKISTSIEIPNEIIEKEIDKFVKKDIRESFKILTRLPYFVPQRDDIGDSVKKICNESIFTKLVGLSSIYGGRKVFQAESEEDSFRHEFNHQYDMAIKIYFNILYKKIWEKLIEKGITCEMVIERITNWGYMGEEDKIIIERGIKSFFGDDFISALHILVPKFESCFRNFFEQGGYATTSIKHNIIQ